MSIDKDQIEKERKAFKEELDTVCTQPPVDLGDGFDETYDFTKPKPLDEFYFTNKVLQLRRAIGDKLRRKKTCQLNLIKEALINRPHVVNDAMKRQVDKRFGVEIAQAIRIRELEIENENLKKLLSQKKQSSSTY